MTAAAGPNRRQEALMRRSLWIWAAWAPAALFILYASHAASAADERSLRRGAAPGVIPPGISATYQVKCPDHVTYVITSTPKSGAIAGWQEQKYGGGLPIDRAQITYQPLYGKDGLQCMSNQAGNLPLAERLVEKGSCTVAPDMKSFNCKLPAGPK